MVARLVAHLVALRADRERRGLRTLVRDRLDVQGAAPCDRSEQELHRREVGVVPADTEEGLPSPGVRRLEPGRPDLGELDAAQGVVTHAPTLSEPRDYCARVTPETPRRPGPSVRRRVVEHRHDAEVRHEDRLATEEPLEIRLAAPGRAATRAWVTMRTPGHDFELAAGWVLHEGLAAPAGITRVAYCTDSELAPEQEFNVVTVTLAHTPELPHRHDTAATGSSACGVCGKESVDAVHAGLPRAGLDGRQPGRRRRTTPARAPAHGAGALRAHRRRARGRAGDSRRGGLRRARGRRSAQRGGQGGRVPGPGRCRPGGRCPRRERACGLRAGAEGRSQRDGGPGLGRCADEPRSGPGGRRRASTCGDSPPRSV